MSIVMVLVIIIIFVVFLREIRYLFPQYEVYGVVTLTDPSFPKEELYYDFPDKQYCILNERGSNAEEKLERIFKEKNVVASLGVSMKQDWGGRANSLLSRLCRAKLKRPYMFIGEHNDVPLYDTSLYDLSMGLSHPEMARGNCGVKIPKFIAMDDNNARAEVLVKIGASEQGFFKDLTGQKFSQTQTYNLAVATEYLKTHRYMYGYIHECYACAQFITANILRYIDLKNVRNLEYDFHIPKAYLTKRLLDLLQTELNKCGIKVTIRIDTMESDLIKITLTTPDGQLGHKVRIFGNRIKNSENWKLLYQISKDGVGASGDNSAEQAYGSRSLPFLFGHLLKSWGRGVQGIAEVLELNQLAKYFDLSVKCLRCSKETIEESIERSRKALSDEEQKKPINAYTPYAIKSCRDMLEYHINIQKNLAELYGLIRDERLQAEWETLHEALTRNPEYNTYKWIPLLMSSEIYINELYNKGLVNYDQLDGLVYEKRGEVGFTKAKFALLMKFHNRMIRDKVKAEQLFAAYKDLEDQQKISYESLLRLPNEHRLPSTPVIATASAAAGAAVAATATSGISPDSLQENLVEELFKIARSKYTVADWYKDSYADVCDSDLVK